MQSQKPKRRWWEWRWLNSDVGDHVVLIFQRWKFIGFATAQLSGGAWFTAGEPISTIKKSRKNETADTDDADDDADDDDHFLFISMKDQKQASNSIRI